AFALDIAFHTRETGVTALFGRSGSGKTSVINMVAGLSRPDEGRIVIGSAPVFDSARRLDLPPERRRIGYVFQDSRLFPHLTVRRNLSYGMERTPPVERFVGFDQVVALLGLDALLDRQPARLSGGEKQRVAIGRALLTSPRLLLMDEPLAALDGDRRNEVLPFIARLRAEFSLPILYVSHAMDEILRLADSLVLLDGGRTAAVGSVEEVMSRLDLRPLTGRHEAGAVVRATVEAHDDEAGLTRLHFAGGQIKVSRMDVPPGGTVRLRLHARDIAIALNHPQGISMQNIIPARVVQVDAANGASCDVLLEAGCPLWARITTQAARELALSPGKPVYALIKSVSISRGDVADWRQE
ncbi:MAG: molybdenum ABC transporter ATP-binding protein, partial [Rhodospirillales bacterium]|nr:molybdenum ABC transporter ATP-binding protein [Rhodospirillales bacterium]